MKNKKYLFVGTISVLLAIIAIMVVLVPVCNETQLSTLPEVQAEPESLNLVTPNPIPAETTLLVTTTAPIITITSPITITEPPVTTTTPLATTTAVTTPTTPPQPAMPDGAQGINEDGNYYKIEDGQKYVWNPVVGWCCDNGPGTVTIMDAKSDGHSFYVEPDGRINLGKVVTPDGEVISYEEYRIIKEVR